MIIDTDKILKVLQPFIIGFIVIFLMMVLAGFAHADDDDDRGGSNVDANANANASASASSIGGDSISTNTFNSSTRAFSISGSDMEINDCLATYSYVFGVIQDTKTNPLCVADRLDTLGKHTEAAQMRCSVRRIRRVYGNNEECVDALEVVPIISSPDLDAIYRQAAQVAEEDYERFEAQQEEIEYMKVQLATIIEQVEQQKTEQQRVASVQQQVQRQVAEVEPPSRYSDEQRAEVFMILGITEEAK